MTIGGNAVERQPAVYILASYRNGTIYIGVTSDLLARIIQHRAGSFGGFTTLYDVKRLVWFEMAPTMEGAIGLEKQLKNWRRAWKLELIEADNPTWRDLAEDWGLAPLPQPSSRA
jgi:putative endonuclease